MAVQLSGRSFVSVADFSTETKDAKGELICTTNWSVIFRMDGGFGGEAPPKSEKVSYPDRAPDFRVESASSLLIRCAKSHT